MKTLLIVNPTSGQGRADRRKRRLLEIVSKMPGYEVRLTAGPDDAAAFARHAAEQGFERIIAAGGDGTVNQVINGMGDSRISLGIVPLGTGNVLAHDLGIPMHVAQAMAIAEEGRVREVDLARAGERRFLLMAGFGFDAAVVDSVSPRVKDVLGTAAYVPAVVEQIVKFAPARFRLGFGGGAEYVTDAFAVIAANCGSYGTSFKIAPQASFDDGLLDILVFEKTAVSKLGFLGAAARLVVAQHISESGVTCLKAARVHVDSDPPVKMQLDGDVCGTSGIEIEVLPKALRLIVP